MIDYKLNSFEGQLYIHTFFKPFSGITAVCCYRFSADFPRVVFYNATPSSEEESFQMLQDGNIMPSSIGPAPLTPHGLAKDHQ